jgi:hypothetical protein
MKILLVIRASCSEDITVVLLSLIYNKCATELESGYYRCQSEFYLPGGGLEIARLLYSFDLVNGKHWPNSDCQVDLSDSAVR